MGKVVPTSFPINRITEDKYRNNFAKKDKFLPEEDKEEAKQQAIDCDESDLALLDLVKEINAYFTSYQQNVLVIIEKKNNNLIISVINAQTHETIIELTRDELRNLAQNLRNHQLSLINKNV